jgi:hypothetical protein
VYQEASFWFSFAFLAAWRETLSWMALAFFSQSRQERKEDGIAFYDCAAGVGFFLRQTGHAGRCSVVNNVLIDRDASSRKRPQN